METFEAIKFNVIGSVQPISEREVVAAEASMRCKFPSDYRRFVKKYGAGDFRGLPVSVLSPTQILGSTAAHQERLRQYWFWEKSAKVLTRQDGMRSIACFDTDIGHDIRFLPEDPSAMFVLSHDDESITRCNKFTDVVRLLDPSCDSHIYEFHAYNAD